MTNLLSTQLKRILKAVKIDRLYYYLRSSLHINKVAIAAEKDLTSLRPVDESLEKAGVKLVVITPGLLMQGSKTEKTLVYPDKKRLKTAMYYLRKGYHGVALVKDGEVCGDIWYVGCCDLHNIPVHPDLKWLRIECSKNEAYAFDMYVYPGKRGGNVANLLQNAALHEIRKNGYSRVYGYYWAENIPALWVHRTLQWKELRKLKVTRFIHLHYSHES